MSSEKGVGVKSRMQVLEEEHLATMLLVQAVGRLTVEQVVKLCGENGYGELVKAFHGACAAIRRTEAQRE